MGNVIDFKEWRNKCEENERVYFLPEHLSMHKQQDMLHLISVLKYANQGQCAIILAAIYNSGKSDVFDNFLDLNNQEEEE
jgi:hypothetical protein